MAAPKKKKKRSYERVLPGMTIRGGEKEKPEPSPRERTQKQLEEWGLHDMHDWFPEEEVGRKPRKKRPRWDTRRLPKAYGF